MNPPPAALPLDIMRILFEAGMHGTRRWDEAPPGRAGAAPPEPAAVLEHPSVADEPSSSVPDWQRMSLDEPEYLSELLSLNCELSSELDGMPGTVLGAMLDDCLPPPALDDLMREHCGPRRLSPEEGGAAAAAPPWRAPEEAGLQPLHIPLLPRQPQPDGRPDLRRVMRVSPDRILPGSAAEQAAAAMVRLAAPSRGRVWPCPYCAHPFDRRHALTLHIRSHIGEKPYRCKTCSMKFINGSARARHVKRCPTTRFQCALCDASFVFKGGLRNHMPTHSSDQPFKCQHCQNTFKRKGSLTQHLLHACKKNGREGV